MKDTGEYPTTSDTYLRRKTFVLRWSAFLHANFASAEVVRTVFSVDASTARDWWNANSAPSGWVVEAAYEDMTTEAFQSLGLRNNRISAVVIEFRSRRAQAEAGSEATPGMGSYPCTDNVAAGGGEMIQTNPQSGALSNERRTTRA